MTKTNSALMSLVAALPGGFLAFLLVMAFFDHADKMGTVLNVIVGFTLLCAVAAALMPAGIMIFGGPKGAAKPKKPEQKKGKDGDEEAGDSAVGLEDADDSAVDELSDDDIASPSGVSDEHVDSDDSGERMEEFESGASSDLMEDSASGDSEEMMDVNDDDAVGKRDVSDEWEVAESDGSDEFEFDDALSDDDLEFDFEDDED